jgi:hypothetical protein
MVYDFTPRNENLGLRTLEVVAAGVQPSGDTTEVVSPGILPFFTLDKPDANTRQNARGQFLRVYPSATGTVQLSAPATYGEWQFYQWADRFGRPLSGGPFTTPIISLSTQGDSAIMAQYVPAASSPRLENPVLTGNDLLVRWNGGTGLTGPPEKEPPAAARRPTDRVRGRRARAAGRGPLPPGAPRCEQEAGLR